MREMILACVAAETGTTRYTTKNKRAAAARLELMKYDPVVRRHVRFVDAKMSKPRTQG